MKIFWSTSFTGNVGDDLNPILWNALFGSDFFDGDPEEIFIGVGSVLSRMWTFEKSARKIVFGAGARSSWSLPAMDDRWDIRFVRGPNTAKLLRHFDVDFITDPAIMLPAVLPRPKRDVPGRPPKIVGFVPHHRTPRSYVERIVADLGLVEVSPHLSPGKFVDALCACDYIVAEAMHGAILADAYRIPWMGVRILNELFEGFTTRFKWNDWLGSLELGDACVVQSAPAMFRFARKGSYKLILEMVGPKAFFDPFIERAIDIIGRSMAAEKWSLSRESVLLEKADRISAEVDRLKRDYRKI